MKQIFIATMIMKPKTEPRKEWEESFLEMHENGDDKSLMPDIFDEESFEEWE